jgi:hypothetical protein
MSNSEFCDRRAQNAHSLENIGTRLRRECIGVLGAGCPSSIQKPSLNQTVAGRVSIPRGRKRRSEQKSIAVSEWFGRKCCVATVEGI